LKFLKQTLALPYQTQKQGLQLAHEVETAIVICLQAFVVKLNEEQLRPFILSIVNWAMKPTDSGFNPLKATILCQVLIGVLHTLREFFVPLIGLYFEPVILEVLRYTSEQLQSAKSKRKRQHHQTKTESFGEDAGNEKLATAVCDLVKFSFKYDAGSFIQADTFERLCDPVSAMLTCTGVADFARFLEDVIKPLIAEMNERINDDAMWIKLNLSLLMHSRNESW
jgi:hypothetical protein